MTKENKIGRNASCPCGSGHKFRVCCGDSSHKKKSVLNHPSIVAIAMIFCLIGVVYASFDLKETEKQSARNSPEAEILHYSEGEWKPTKLKNLSAGDQFKTSDESCTYKGEKYLCYFDENSLLRLNTDVPLSKLRDAERSYDRNNSRAPGNQDVVRFIDKETRRHMRFDRMDRLRSDENFWFQGRLYEGRTDPENHSDIFVRETGIVLSRVTNVFKRKADTLVDLAVRDEKGNESVISGTPEHPFFVPIRREYVEMGRLAKGVVLETDDGSAVEVVSKKFRHGEFDVYNLEVEGMHNYYVSPVGGMPSVLVHNMCRIRLKRLHPDSTLKVGKLDSIRKMDTDDIIKSLKTEGREKLTIRPDGTVLQGNHRIKVLEERGFDTSELFKYAAIEPKKSIAPWED